MGVLFERAEVKIGLLTGNEDASKAVESFFKMCPTVHHVARFSDKPAIHAALKKNEINCICIDLFSTGVESGLEFITDVRSKYFQYPICLLGTKQQLEAMPEVPMHWQYRFEHYYKYPFDVSVPDGRSHAAVIADLFLADQAKAQAVSPVRTLMGKFNPQTYKRRRFFQKDSVQGAIVGACLAGTFAILVQVAVKLVTPQQQVITHTQPSSARE